jgi:hypothetical protein
MSEPDFAFLSAVSKSQTDETGMVRREGARHWAAKQNPAGIIPAGYLLRFI